MSATERLLDGVRNYGGVLGPVQRDALRRMLLSPGQDAWAVACELLVTSDGRTLEHAVFRVDSAVHHQGLVPDPFTVRRALLWAAACEGGVSAHG